MTKGAYVTSVVHSFEDEMDRLPTLRSFDFLSPQLQWGIIQMLNLPRWEWNFDITIDVTCHPGDPGRVNCLPEDAYPPEPPYAEVDVDTNEFARWMRLSIMQVHGSLWTLFNWTDTYYLWDLFAKMLNNGIDHVEENYLDLVDFPDEGGY